MLKSIPLGVENYIEACSYYYVDKTMIVKDIIDKFISRPLLITRPRRFGKSLMLSMIDCFFNNKYDYKKYFKNRKIYSENKYLEYLNSYPVIHLNMKNISSVSYDSMIHITIDMIGSIYRSFGEILNNDLFDIEIEKYQNFANVRYSDVYLYADSIKFLSELLYRKYKKKVVILIDEYDTPLENAFQNGFYDQAIEFFKRFYSATLKANDYALLSIVTGVLQISKESIFSELNNLNVFSVVDDDFIEYFGFTQDEVNDILKYYNIDCDYKEIEKYYSGYGNNNCNIYNPWSVLSFVQKEEIAPYWVNSGSNNTIRNLIDSIPNSINKLNEFTNNKKISFKFNNYLSYRDVKNDYETLFSFLVQSGYLVARKVSKNGDYNLFIPNQEIKEVFEKEIIARNASSDEKNIALKLRDAIKTGNIELISEFLSKYIITSFSYFDLTREKDYQNIITGILSVLFSDYLVKSEVNNKNGRCDIMLLPKSSNDVGMVIEIKYYKGRIGKSRLELYASKALDQIEDREYYNELVKYDCKKCFIYAFVFDDKNNQVSLREI